MKKMYVFDYGEKKLRVEFDVIDAWFNLEDVCNILGGQDISEVIEIVKDYETYTSCEIRYDNSIYIDEYGLIALFLNFDTGESDSLRHFVTDTLKYIKKAEIYSRLVDDLDNIFNTSEKPHFQHKIPNL